MSEEPHAGPESGAQLQRMNVTTAHEFLYGAIESVTKQTASAVEHLWHTEAQFGHVLYLPSTAMLVLGSTLIVAAVASQVVPLLRRLEPSEFIASLICSVFLICAGAGLRCYQYGTEARLRDGLQKTTDKAVDIAGVIATAGKFGKPPAAK